VTSDRVATRRELDVIQARMDTGYAELAQQVKSLLAANKRLARRQHQADDDSSDEGTGEDPSQNDQPMGRRNKHTGSGRARNRSSGLSPSQEPRDRDSTAGDEIPQLEETWRQPHDQVNEQLNELHRRVVKNDADLVHQWRTMYNQLEGLKAAAMKLRNPIPEYAPGYVFYDSRVREACN
jgi:hypothetical protein